MTYRKAILIHAYGIPLGIVLLLGLILTVVPARFRASQNLKRDDYASYLQVQQQVHALEGKLAGKKELAAAWQQTLATEFTTSLNNLLTNHLKTLDGRQLEQTSNTRPGGGNGLSVTGGQPASRIQLEFRGGFEPMQTTLLVMESKLPQMQLESLDISEDTGGDGLKFAMTYTAWEKSAK